MRECGLKCPGLASKPAAPLSLLVRECGLKFQTPLLSRLVLGVTSRARVRIEIIAEQTNSAGVMRHFSCESAD